MQLGTIVISLRGGLYNRAAPKSFGLPQVSGESKRVVDEKLKKVWIRVVNPLKVKLHLSSYVG